MHKNISLFQKTIFSTCLALALTSVSHAEIYKWVDASGKTHYPENKDEAGTNKTEELKIKSKPVPAPTSTTDWRKQEEEFRQRLAQKPNAPVFRPPNSPQANSAPRGGQLETDASRYKYATDLNNGN